MQEKMKIHIRAIDQMLKHGLVLKKIHRVISFQQSAWLQVTRYKYLVMKPNFKDGRKFSENLMGVEMGKYKIKMTKPVYLRQAILDLSKIVMYEIHYVYMLPKYGGNCLQFCYMNTDSFVYHIKTEGYYKDLAGNVEKRFNTSNYNKEEKRPLPIGLN